MRVQDAAHQMLRNDLDRAMKDLLCTSKEEMTRKVEARSRDETTDNVWHRMTICDHVLELKTWRHDDPKPLRGISYATATRHLRILRKRLEKIMGKSARRGDPPWTDLPKQHCELLWLGEAMWKKYGALMLDSSTLLMWDSSTSRPSMPKFPM